MTGHISEKGVAGHTRHAPGNSNQCCDTDRWANAVMFTYAMSLLLVDSTSMT